MSQIPALGKIDEDAGEFWVENPFMMPANGDNLSAYERNCIFVNVDGENFLDASFASDADIDSDSRTVISADFDNDGAMDLLVGSVGGGPLRLFKNNMKQGHYLRIDLVGTKSNRFGVGSRIIAKVGDRQIVRDAFPAGGFMGVGPTQLNFGLGGAEVVDTLTVRWPTGETQEFANIQTDQTIEITEGEAEIATK
ncbi:ASPIC/UnbV domain-containing protein [bacterium]|nr:ASPIC/UnbV domain-containing protein [bacterium]